jgi:hypothetical protein
MVTSAISTSGRWLDFLSGPAAVFGNPAARSPGLINSTSVFLHSPEIHISSALKNYRMKLLRDEDL